VDGCPRRKSQCTGCSRHDDEECTEESLRQHLWSVNAVSCDTVWSLLDLVQGWMVFKWFSSDDCYENLLAKWLWQYPRSL
jgi:hypothetical protein